VVRHHEAEHRIPQELEALVRLVARVLRAPRPVRERRGEVGLVGERRAEPSVERREPGDGKQL
jgi:hypothetical protein